MKRYMFWAMLALAAASLAVIANVATVPEPVTAGCITDNDTPNGLHVKSPATASWPARAASDGFPSRTSMTSCPRHLAR